MLVFFFVGNVWTWGRAGLSKLRERKYIRGNTAKISDSRKTSNYFKKSWTSRAEKKSTGVSNRKPPRVQIPPYGWHVDVTRRDRCDSLCTESTNEIQTSVKYSGKVWCNYSLFVFGKWAWHCIGWKQSVDSVPTPPPLSSPLFWQIPLTFAIVLDLLSTACCEWVLSLSASKNNSKAYHYVLVESLPFSHKCHSNGIFGMRF